MRIYDVVFSTNAGEMERQRVVAETLELAQPQFNSLIMLMIMSSGGVQPGDKFEVIGLEDTYPDHEY